MYYLISIDENKCSQIEYIGGRIENKSGPISRFIWTTRYIFF